jgi:hypothetical protein
MGLASLKNNCDKIVAVNPKTNNTIFPPLTLRQFIREFWPVVEPGRSFIHNWHIDAIADHLTAISNGQLKDLIINVPPGHMKSLSVAVFWPAWEWAEINPGSRWLFSSYAQNLSRRDSVKCRRLIQSPEYQTRYGDKFELAGDQNEKLRFETNKTGFRQATSTGGLGTGERVDRVVCLPWDEVISTDVGEVSIGLVVEGKLDVRVATFNHDLNQVEYLPILRHEVNPGREIIEIDLGDRVLRCTEDHLVWVDGKGYVKAGDLGEGDEVWVLD